MSKPDSKQLPDQGSLPPPSADLLEILEYYGITDFLSEENLSEFLAALQTVMLEVIGEDEKLAAKNIETNSRLMMGASINEPISVRNNLRARQRKALSLKLQKGAE